MDGQRTHRRLRHHERREGSPRTPAPVPARPGALPDVARAAAAVEAAGRTPAAHEHDAGTHGDPSGAPATAPRIRRAVTAAPGPAAGRTTGPATRVRRATNVVIRRHIADAPTRIQLADEVVKLLATGGSRVPIKAIETRVRAGELDAADLLDVRARLNTKWTTDQATIEAPFKPGKRTKVHDAVQAILGQLDTWANGAMPAAYGPAVVAPLKTGPEEETEIRPGPGKRRIVVPKAKQARTATVGVAGIRFSQATARGTTGQNTPLSTVIEHMTRTGWRGDPVELVRMDGSYTRFALPAASQGICSIDNRRLVAALAAGLTEVPAVTHAPTETMDATWAAEPQNALRYPLWRKDDGTLKVDTKRNFHETADATWTLVMPQSSHPETYGDLIVIRTVNQGEMNLLPGLFPLGGTERVPEVTGQTF